MKIQPIVASNNQSKPQFGHVKLVLDKECPVLQNYLNKAAVESACQDKYFSIYKKQSRNGFKNLLSLIDKKVAKTELNLNKCIEVLLISFGLSMEEVAPEEDVFKLSIEPKEKLAFEDGRLTKKHPKKDKDNAPIDPVYKRDYVAKLKRDNDEFIIYEHEMGDIADKWRGDGYYDLAGESLRHFFDEMEFVRLTPDCLNFVYRYLSQNPIFARLVGHKIETPVYTASLNYAGEFLDTPMQELSDWMKR